MLSTADGGRTWSRETAVPGTRAAGGNFAPTDVAFTSRTTGIAVEPVRAGSTGPPTGPAPGASCTTAPAVLDASTSSHPLVGLRGGQPDRAEHRRRRRDVDGEANAAGSGCAASAARRARLPRHHAVRPVVLRTSDGGATWSLGHPSSTRRSWRPPSRAPPGGRGGRGRRHRPLRRRRRDLAPVGKRLAHDVRARPRALRLGGVRDRADGTLARSNDGGVTWSEVGVSTSEDVIDVSFADEAVGYALDAAGTLLRTDNAGQSWQILNTGTPRPPQAVLALGSQDGPAGRRPRESCARPTAATPSRACAAGSLNRAQLFNVDRGGGRVFVYGSKNIFASPTAGARGARCGRRARR